MVNPVRVPVTVGREQELAALEGFMADAISGRGSAVLVSGEAGLGKTRLLEEAVARSRARGMRVLRGRASPDSGKPFIAFTSALGMADRLLTEEDSTSFTALFAVNRAGLLVAKSSSAPETDMDADIFAGMLSAVQNFVRDSFDSSGARHGNLGRLEYGSMKIIIKHGGEIFLAAVLGGQEHEDMDPAIQKAVDSIEAELGEVLKSWTGRQQDVKGVQAAVDALAARRFPVRRSLVGMKLDNERNRIADMLLERVVELSLDMPVMLTLEDLHWADDGSLAALAYMARSMGEERVLLLGTFRPDESKSLSSALERMEGEGTVRELALRRLDTASLRPLVDSMLSPNDLPDEFMDRLSAQCAGNPFFTSEIIRHMVQDGSVAPVGGRYTLLAGDYTIPGTVEEVVQRRLDCLDADAMAMVEYVSCIGTEFDRGLAKSMPSLKDPEGALERLVASDIIVIKEGGTFFCHGIFRDVTYGGIADRWRIAYHRCLGEHLERSWDGTGEVLYDLARHFFRSAETRKAHHYCLRAADLAESSFAPEQAAGFLADALSLVHALGLGAAEPAARAGLNERIADLAELMGDYDRAAGLLSAVIGSEDVEDKEAKARAARKMTHLLEIKGRFDEALALASEARRLLGPARSHEMALIVMQEATVLEQKRELDRSIVMQREALAIMEEASPGHKDLARIHSRIGTCLWTKNDFDSALASYMKGMEISEANNDARGIAAANNNIGIVHIRKGDYNAAEVFLARGRDIYRRIGDQSGLASVSGNLGNVYMAKGDFDGAMAAYQLCLKIFTRLGAKIALGTTYTNMGGIHQHRGEFGKAMNLYLRSKAIREDIGDRRGLGITLLNIGNLQYDMGDYDNALIHFQEGKALMAGIGESNGVTHALNGIVRAEMRLGRTAGLMEMVDEALAISRKLGMAENEHVALVLRGRVLALAGDWAAAGESFEKAIAWAASGGYRRTLADAVWGRGEMRAMKGDVEAGLADLREAKALYVEMDQPHIVAEVERDIARFESA